MSVLVMAMVFAAVMLFAYGVLATVFSDEMLVKKSLKGLDAYEVAGLYEAEPTARPFFERTIVPLYHRLSSVVKRLSPKEIDNSVAERLVQAGSPTDMDVDRFLSLKLLSSLVAGLFIIALFIFKGFSGQFLVIGVALVVLAYFLPDLWLRNLIQKRQKQVGLALSSTLDLLTISIEAGLGFDAALAKVVKNYPGPLAEEFSQVLREMQMGVARREALKSLADRTDVDELRTFISTIIQADTLGVSIGNVLRVQASEMRLKRRQRAEEAGHKVPVKIIFPLVLCIFPAFFVVIVGPGVIRLVTSLMGHFQ